MTSNNIYFDTSLINIQKDYLNSIKGNVNLTNEQNDQLNNLTNTLTSINDNLGTSSTSALYSQQKSMINILDKEQQRLNLKKNKIDTAIDGKQRVLDLNESVRAKNADYIHILFVFIIALTIVIIINRILYAFSIPSVVSYLVYIVVFSITFIYMYIKYLEIDARDKLYYDKLYIKPPKILTPEEIRLQTEQEQDKAKQDKIGQD